MNDQTISSDSDSFDAERLKRWQQYMEENDLKVAFWSNLHDFRIAKREEVLSELDRLTLSLSGDQIIQKAIDLTVKEFDLVFVGVYVVDSSNQTVILQAGTGRFKQILDQRKPKWPLSSPAPVCEAINRVAVCVTGSSPITGIFYSPLLPGDLSPFQFIETFVGSPLIPEIESELIIPCLKAGKVVGAIEFGHRFRWDRNDISLLLPVAEKIAFFYN